MGLVSHVCYISDPRVVHVVSNESVWCGKMICHIDSRQAEIVRRCERLQNFISRLYDNEVACRAWNVVIKAFRRRPHVVVTEKPVPETVRRVCDACERRGLLLYHMQVVDGDYYEWGLSRRAGVLGAPSIDHLCKTIVVENTKFSTIAGDDNSDAPLSRYYMIVIQYTARLDTERLQDHLHARSGIARKKLNFQMCDEDVALPMTGFGKNGICPVGSREEIPIIVDRKILHLKPAMFWMGGGDIDWKLVVETVDFIGKMEAECLEVSCD